MTKKDYELIAGVFNSVMKSADTHVSKKQAEIERYEASSTARLLADELQRDNPKFDRTRFLQACGVEG